MNRAPTAPPSPRTSTANPFPGPQPYDRADQEYFFGREDEIEELTSLVLTSSATLVYAPSGAGKSSLLRAGVSPALERDFDVLVLPTVHFGTVARADSTGGAPNSFVRTVCESIAGIGGPGETPLDIGALAARERGESSRRVLLVLDQFEEVFNDPALWEQREEFFRALTTALDTHPWLRAVVALRSDYLADLVPYERMLPGRLAVRYQLENLTEDQAAVAIRSAFEASGVPLPDEDLTRLLDLLLEDAAVPHARAQYVNTIQLQIVCRRLWQRLVKPGAAGRSALGSDFSVRESMVQFVDGAIGEAVSRTRGDEKYVRWWLQNQLVTPADHRAFVLVEGTHAAGLPIRVVETLVAARLLQVEQRHGSRLAELTHDSMVGALRASNERWRRDMARRRHRVTAVLAGVLLILVATFPFLRLPDGGEQRSDAGRLTDQPIDAWFVGDGTADVVVLDLYATVPVEVTVVERRPGASTHRTVASQTIRTEETPAAIPVLTREGVDYRVRLDPQARVSPDDYYELSVSDLPLGPDDGQGREEVSTSAFGIPLDRGTRTMLFLPNTGLAAVGGVKVLAQDWVNGWTVVEPTETNTIAVVFFPYAGTWRPSDGVIVTWRPLGQPEEVPLGEQVGVQGETPVLRSFSTQRPDPVLGAVASCSSSVQMFFVGAGASLSPDAGRPLLHHGSSAVLPLNVAAGRHVVALASNDGKPVDCTLSVRSFGMSSLTAFGAHDLEVDGGGAGAYATEMPADTVLVAEPRTDAVLRTVCRDAAPQPSDPLAPRILFYLPRDGDCAVWLSSTDPSSGTSVPIWLAPAEPNGGG